MNRQPEKEADDGFAAHAKRRFDESVDRIDGSTQSKLTSARHAALAEIRPARAATMRWAPLAGVAAAAALAAVLWTSGLPEQDRAVPEVADIEILLTEDSLEMLEDLEFFSWIDLEDGSEALPEPENNVG
jgi:hypothetical protein